MKLTLSKKQLLDALTRAFEMEVTEVVITRPPKFAEKFIADFAAAAKYDVALVRTARGFVDKIGAIKVLRTFIPGMGLADAKWVVENWQPWLASMKEYNRYPKLAGYYPNFTLS